jgi:hypothetical protein
MSKVDLVEMDKIGQLFDRQKGYLTTGQSFLATNARPAGYTGVLSLLEPHYRTCYDAGTTGMGHGVKIAETCATTIRSNFKQYVADDRAAYEQLNKYNKNAAPYPYPSGQLGAGGSRAPSGGPGMPQRIWDGAKWVTSWTKKATSPLSTVNDWSQSHLQSSNKATRVGKLADKNKSDLDPPKWLQDPAGYVKDKVSEAAKAEDVKAYNKAHGTTLTPEEYDKRIQNQWWKAMGKPDGPTASQQHSMNTVLSAAQLPGQLVGTIDDIIDEGKQTLEEIERARRISQLKGTDNTGSTAWANSNGGTW